MTSETLKHHNFSQVETFIRYIFEFVHTAFVVFPLTEDTFMYDTTDNATSSISTLLSEIIVEFDHLVLFIVRTAEEEKRTFIPLMDYIFNVVGNKERFKMTLLF